MGGLLGHIFGTLTGASRADKLRQENIEFHKNKTLLDAALKGEAPPEYGDAAIEAMTKMSGKHGKAFMEALQNARQQQEQQKPNLQVPQLTPPPGQQQAPDFNSPEGGMDVPPPPNMMQTHPLGPPLPHPTPGQLPQPVVNGPMGPTPHLYRPAERGQAAVAQQTPGLENQIKMGLQQRTAMMDFLTKPAEEGGLGIDINTLTAPQRTALMGVNLPEAPFNKLSPGETGIQAGKTFYGGPQVKDVSPGSKLVSIPSGPTGAAPGAVPPPPGQGAPATAGATELASAPPLLTGPEENLRAAAMRVAQKYSIPFDPEKNPRAPLLQLPARYAREVQIEATAPTPDMGIALSAYANTIGKSPGELTPPEQAKAVALWHEMSDPLGTAVKKSTLATQASTRASQEITRMVAKNELELANDADTVGYAAAKYRITGQMPPLGQKSALLRAKILGEAAKQEIAAGNSKEAAAIAPAIFASNKAALTQIVTQRAKVGAFEKAAGKNLDVFLAQAKQITDTGSPIINQVFRGAERKLTGGLEAFDASRITAFNEVGKVLSGSMSQAVSDSARHEAESVIGKEYTIAGLVKAIGILRTDMKNRMDAFDEEEAEIKKAMNPSAISGTFKYTATGPTGEKVGSNDGVTWQPIK